MNKTTIRKTNLADAKSLAYIQTVSWKNAFKYILNEEELDRYTNIDNATKMYTELHQNNIGNSYILTIDNIGHCIAFWDENKDKPNSAEIISIHSLPLNWSKGYGTQMMNHVLEDIKQQGYDKVYLWVFKDNDRACNFYEKNGFVYTGKTKLFNNVKEVLYCKELK